MGLFDKTSLERLSSPEHLNQRLRVVTFKGWIALATIGAIVFCILVWSCFGSIPVIIEGKGIVFDPDRAVLVRSEMDGTVDQIYVKSGDKVESGSALMSLKNPLIAAQLLEKQLLIASLENFIQSDNELEQSEKNEIRKQILVESVKVEALQFEKEKERIVAPHQGTVVNISIEGLVTPGSVLVWMETPRQRGQPQKIYAVFPSNTGELIHENMEAEIALASVDQMEYGKLFGRVQHVYPYLTSLEQGPFRSLPSQNLKEFLSKEDEQGGVIVEIEPDLDAATVSGYRWASKKGPPFLISEGSLGIVKVVLERKRPISYLIPALAKPGTKND